MSRKSVGDGELYGLRHVTLLKKKSGEVEFFSPKRRNYFLLCSEWSSNRVLSTHMISVNKHHKDD